MDEWAKLKYLWESSQELMNLTESCQERATYALLEQMRSTIDILLINHPYINDSSPAISKLVYTCDLLCQSALCLFMFKDPNTHSESIEYAKTLVDVLNSTYQAHFEQEQEFVMQTTPLGQQKPLHNSFSRP